MPKSEATTVAGYLEELPPERRETIAAVRDVVVKNLPKGYEESMSWGMIAWQVPLSRYPDTYNKQPLLYAALSSQKNYCAIYLTCVYFDPARLATLKEGFKEAGKKLDIGKSCIRFQRADDLPLKTIGKLVAGFTPAAFIKLHESSREKTMRGK
jgi:hypothetical protein